MKMKKWAPLNFSALKKKVFFGERKEREKGNFRKREKEKEREGNDRPPIVWSCGRGRLWKSQTASFESESGCQSSSKTPGDHLLFFFFYHHPLWWWFCVSVCVCCDIDLKVLRKERDYSFDESMWKRRLKDDYFVDWKWCFPQEPCCSGFSLFLFLLFLVMSESLMIDCLCCSGFWRMDQIHWLVLVNLGILK